MLRRTLNAVFAGGMYVFPGGRVETTDGDDVDRAHRLAAIRECFEEAGVLLAHTPGTFETIADGHPALAARTGVHDGVDRPADAVRPSTACEPAIEQLVWVATGSRPKGETPRRFDTRFYLVPRPGGSDARPTTTTRPIASLWVRPSEALHRQDAGELMMMPPTITNLQFLAQFDTVADGDGRGAGRCRRRGASCPRSGSTPTARSRASPCPTTPTTTHWTDRRPAPATGDWRLAGEPGRLSWLRRCGRRARRSPATACGPSSRPCWWAARPRRRSWRAMARNSSAAGADAVERHGRPGVAAGRHRRPRAGSGPAAARRSRRPAPARRPRRTARTTAPCSHVNALMFSMTPHTRRKLRRAMSAARAATFCAASAGVVTMSRSVRGSMRARPICTSPVPGGMSMNR